MIAQNIKNRLAGLGPDNTVLRTALRLSARLRGYGVRFDDSSIVVRKGPREVALRKAQYVQVPTVIACFDQLFEAIECERRNGVDVLNFSEPKLHRYTRSRIGFYFPAIPEEDQIRVYISCYVPKTGDVVWDAGAHAGATAYFLAQMVGPQGKVYAFVPDASNLEYLKKNIDLHGLRNVIPVGKALAGSSGTEKFNMDGTMCAGLSKFALYSDSVSVRDVPTMTLADACAELGCVPNFVKMDIEGAEVAVIESSLEFLKTHPIHFAIESFHRIDGKLTYEALEGLFSRIGYSVRSSDEFGQMFTWAGPHPIVAGE